MRADKALQVRGLARSRTHAQQLIAAGSVLRSGRRLERASREVAPEELSLVDEATGLSREISRAQRKLAAALDLWPGVLTGTQVAVDVGASTGGFTQELLLRGVPRVWAVDVGHDQLASVLREDDRVVVREGVNARDPEQLAAAGLGPGMADVVVCDVSFISMRLVLPTLSWLLRTGGRGVVLIKPQFEVGPQGTRQGVVEDVRLRRGAVRSVLEVMEGASLRAQALAVSPLEGTHGNVEFLVALESTAREPRTDGSATGDAEDDGGSWHSGLPLDTDAFWAGRSTRVLDLTGGSDA